MWNYIIRRLFWVPFLLLVVSFVTFLLFRMGPGDPVLVILGNKYDPQSQSAVNLREELGIDKPLMVQFVNYARDFFQGDFGESYRYRGQPVRDLIAAKMWVSAQLSLAALLISTIIGIPLGFFIAHKQGKWQDPTIVTICLVVMSIPVMVFVPVLLWLLCLKNLWIPFWGGIPCSGWGGLFDQRIIVPALSMGLPGVAVFVRLMRESTLDVMKQDYIVTAHSKGLSPFVIDIRHVFRNSVIPIITILSFSLAGLIGGAIITETIMGIPGIGRLAVQSVFDRDYPVIMAITLVTAGFFAIANLFADIMYALVDPRIRYG